MQIYIPILGLQKNFQLPDIQEIEILNLDSPGKSILPPLSNTSQKAVFMLGLIDQIYAAREKRGLHAVFKFPDLNNPSIFQGQEDIESIGLGLLTLAYQQTVKCKSRRRYEIACISGVLKRYPTREEILSSGFIDQSTGRIEQKFNTFLEFLENHRGKECKAVFIYSGSEEQEKLQKQARVKGFPALTVKRVETFRELLYLLYKDTLVSSRSRLWFVLCAAALLILAGTIFAVQAWWSQSRPVNRYALFKEKLQWSGGGELLDVYKYNPENKTLGLEPCGGYIFTGLKSFSLREYPFLTVVADGRSYNNGLFLEIKNQADQLIISRKLKIEFPFTDFQFRTFSCDLTPFIENQDDDTAMLALSDPEDTMIIRDIIFSRQQEAQSIGLTYDGRRFAGETRPDILHSINLQPGGEIVFQQNTELRLKESRGWLWSVLPDTDIILNRFLHIIVKTSGPAAFNLELKHKAGGQEWAMIGDQDNDRMLLFLPDTDGEFREVVFLLTIRPGMEALRLVHIIAISDPTGDITINRIFFDPDQSIEKFNEN